MPGPTDQRNLSVQALQHEEQREQAFPQQQQPPRQPQLAMQQQQSAQKLPPRAPSPSPRVFGGAALAPAQGIGAAAQAQAAARARAAEQMAFEDAWKASNPDFRTPFASVEDAVSRLLPYHVFAEYEDDEFCDPGAEERSYEQKWLDTVEAVELEHVLEFEKQVLLFNVMARQRVEGTRRAEERLMLERSLEANERLQSDLVCAAIRQEQQQEQAARARLALVQAQAASAWPLVQPAAWQQALATAVARGEGIPGAGHMAAPAVVMLPQQEPAAAGAWQQAGVWTTFMAPRGEGSSSGQAAPTVMQQQGGGLSTSGVAAAGMVQPWWGSSAQRRE